ARSLGLLGNLPADVLWHAALSLLPRPGIAKGTLRLAGTANSKTLGQSPPAAILRGVHRLVCHHAARRTTIRLESAISFLAQSHRSAAANCCHLFCIRSIERKHFRRARREDAERTWSESDLNRSVRHRAAPDVC